MAGSGCQHETTQHLATGLHEELDLAAGQTAAVDGPDALRPTAPTRRGRVAIMGRSALVESYRAARRWSRSTSSPRTRSTTSSAGAPELHESQTS